MSEWNSQTFWGEVDIFKRLEEFLYKPQFAAVRKNVHSEYFDKYEMDTEDRIDFVRDLMNAGDGSLEIFGPAELLYADLFKFFDPVMTEGFNYVDDQLQFYMPKNTLFKLANNLTWNLDTHGIDTELKDLLTETFAAKVNRQLKGSFEIVTADAYEHLEKMIKKKIREVENQKLPNQMEKAEWDALKPKAKFEKILSFWNFNDEEIDFKAKLYNYVMTSGADLSKMSYKSFLQAQKLHGLLEFIVSHHYIFNTFEAAEKKKCDETMKFDSFIRLFHDGEKKFLFCRDVRNELMKALNRKYKGRLAFDYEEFQGVVDIENDEDLEEGRYFLMSYEKYLETVDRLLLGRDAITLVNVEVKRTRHLTVPIISPYGTPCKPMVDVFFEILSILTIELQAWQRLPPEEMRMVADPFLMSMVTLVHPDKPNHMVSTDYVDRIGSYLRDVIGRVLDAAGASYQKVEQFEDGQKPLTWYLLYEEVIDKWHIDFPFATRSVDIVFAKNIDFRGPKLVSRLELTLMVQECLVFCMLANVPGMRHVLGFCDFAPCIPCRYSISFKHQPMRFSPGAVASVVRSEPDYQIKLNYFPNDDMVHASLVDKKKRENLVTSEMARSFVFQALMQQIGTTSFGPVIRMTFSHEMNNKWATSETKSDDFLMTTEEMLQLSAEVKKKYTTKPDLSELLYGLEDCMRYTNRCVKSLTSFAECSLNRKFYLKVTQELNVEKGEKEGHVNSGDFLEAVHIMMNQDSNNVRKVDWDLLHQYKKRWHSAIGWISIPVEDALESLKQLPVNPERFIFVPDINQFFWKIVADSWKEGCELRGRPVRHDRPMISNYMIDCSYALKRDFTNLRL